MFVCLYETAHRHVNWAEIQHISDSIVENVREMHCQLTSSFGKPSFCYVLAEDFSIGFGTVGFLLAEEEGREKRRGE